VSLSLPPLIRRLEEIGSVKTDYHKNSSSKVACPGGLAILLGYFSGSVLTGLLGLNESSLLIIAFVTVLGAVVGLVDDLLSFKKATIICFTIIMGLPLWAFYQGGTVIDTFFWGLKDIGILYLPLSILGISFLSNAVNIYSPLNGLESGLAFITCTGLTICALLYDSMESAISLAIMASCLLAFLRWNKYPSKIFLGNIGTYMIGSLIASAIIAGSIKVAGIIACFPYFLNFFFRTWDRFEKFTADITKDGLIIASKPGTLWSLFVLNKPRHERTVVIFSWIIQTMFSLTAIFYSLIRNS
jgi:UDP-N-acetylglucosamine--dolichyl-phosphate N-acetylglucosaminephosphotransferase